MWGPVGPPRPAHTATPASGRGMKQPEGPGGPPIQRAGSNQTATAATRRRSGSPSRGAGGGPSPPRQRRMPALRRRARVGVGSRGGGRRSGRSRRCRRRCGSSRGRGRPSGRGSRGRDRRSNRGGLVWRNGVGGRNGAGWGSVGRGGEAVQLPAGVDRGGQHGGALLRLRGFQGDGGGPRSSQCSPAATAPTSGRPRGPRPGLPRPPRGRDNRPQFEDGRRCRSAGRSKGWASGCDVGEPPAVPGWDGSGPIVGEGAAGGVLAPRLLAVLQPAASSTNANTTATAVLSERRLDASAPAIGANRAGRTSNLKHRNTMTHHLTSVSDNATLLHYFR